MNRYYVIPVSELKEIDPDWKTRRTNTDETKALIHVDTLDKLVAEQNAGIMTLSDSESIPQIIPYPIYSGEELTELLSSKEWLPDYIE